MRLTDWMLSGVLLASQAAQTPVKRQCNISVLDREGAIVSGAHVHVYRDELFGNAFEQTFIADKRGIVHFAVVDGWYDICVMRGAFTPQCREIDVEGKDASIRFTLTVSPEMEKQIGDRIY
jgi:hypothetical protein